MSEVRDIAQEYHRAYCEATGLNMKYTFSLYTLWYLFAKEFKAEDLETVVRHLRKIYRDKPDILRACLRLPKLIEDHAMFASYLAEAQAEARKPKKTEKERLLERTCTGTRIPEPDTTKPVSELALEMLRKCKENL